MKRGIVTLTALAMLASSATAQAHSEPRTSLEAANDPVLECEQAKFLAAWRWQTDWTQMGDIGGTPHQMSCGQRINQSAVVVRSYAFCAYRLYYCKASGVHDMTIDWDAHATGWPGYTGPVWNFSNITHVG